MASGTEPRPLGYLLAIGGLHISTGRSDGNILITITNIPKFSNFSLNKTASITMDIITDKGAYPIVCDFDATNSQIYNDGHLYLRFIPTTDITPLYTVDRVICINVTDSLQISLS